MWWQPVPPFSTLQDLQGKVRRRDRNSQEVQQTMTCLVCDPQHWTPMPGISTTHRTEMFCNWACIRHCKHQFAMWFYQLGWLLNCKKKTCALAFVVTETRATHFFGNLCHRLTVWFAGRDQSSCQAAGYSAAVSVWFSASLQPFFSEGVDVNDIN